MGPLKFWTTSNNQRRGVGRSQGMAFLRPQQAGGTLGMLLAPQKRTTVPLISKLPRERSRLSIHASIAVPSPEHRPVGGSASCRVRAVADATTTTLMDGSI